MVRPPGSLESDLLLVVSRHATDPAGVHRVELTVPGYDGVGERVFSHAALARDREHNGRALRGGHGPIVS